MTAEDIAIVDMDGKWLEGPYKPSSEYPMHATIYTEEMAQTTYLAKVLGTYEPMPEEAEKAMQALIAADQAV